MNEGGWPRLATRRSSVEPASAPRRDASTSQVRDLFENLQEHLEKFTESLSGMTELPVDQMDRTEIVNVTRCTESFLANLIQGVDSGLDIEDEPVATA